ncbi:MAG: isoprenylcysteine carboxylmethyltransferase family protein [Armatimonadetes bacterium]|nr:isoprenylcysteine carboxylmethyltransferase family protein [Armatimonadota bacterium]
METLRMQGLWLLVIIQSAAFILFAASFLTPKRRRDWRSMGVFAAFVVAMFTEMYGFPLTVYLLAPHLQNLLGVTDPFLHAQMWGVLLGLGDFGKTVICLIGEAIMLAGFWLLWAGWRRVHGAKGELVVEGPYRYIRHPQYLGLMVIIFGALVWWPTLSTLLMAPILFGVYYHLAKREERDMLAQFGDAYRRYMARVPAFLPWLGARTPAESH